MIIKSQYNTQKSAPQNWVPRINSKIPNSQNESSSESWVNLTTDEERYVCQIKSSNYAIHSDNDISVAVQNTGDIP